MVVRLRRVVFFAIVVVGVGVGVGCGVDLVGKATDDTPPGGPDAMLPDGASDAGTGTDTTTAIDTGADAGVDACGLTLPNTTGELAAHRADAGAITINGFLDDWGCTPFVRMDKQSAIVRPDGGQPVNVVDFAARWDEAALYFAARVTDPLVGGALPDPYDNDSIELYLDADGVLTGAFATTDHQYAVDYRNSSWDYGFFPSRAAGAGFSSAVKVAPPGFTIELRVGIEELGLANLASGMKLGFDFIGNDSDGTQRVSQLLWYSAPTCTCTANCCCGQALDHPYCNTQRFGLVTLGN